jgi:hypothetical protein
MLGNNLHDLVLDCYSLVVFVMGVVVVDQVILDWSEFVEGSLSELEVQQVLEACGGGGCSEQGEGGGFEL